MMKIYRLILAGMTVAAAAPASAAVPSVRGTYLRTYGPSPLRFAAAATTVVGSPAQAAFVLPPLARGDEVDQPPAPRYLPLPGSALANPTQVAVTAAAGPPPDPDSLYGPEPPTTDLPEPNPSIPVNLDPYDTPPAGPGLHGAPVSPGMLMPFFSQPQGDGARVVVPMQFSPAQPPPIRSSRATYNKQ
jgi:hypothetical protein